jgi:YD repeat-containing protein
MVSTSYNSAARMTQMNLAQFNGVAVNFNYYAVPQTQSPSSWGYWPTGEMNRGTYGNGVIETTGYNSRMEMSFIADAKGSTTLFSKTYGLYDSAGDNNGNVLSITDGLNAANNQAYTYDSLNRLLTASQADNSFNVSYMIDPWGNMKESGTSNFNQTFDPSNRISGWSYDAAGDLLNDGAHSYAYDAEGRIKSVDTSAATYIYYADGSRARKDANGVATEYIYFGNNVIAEKNPDTGTWTDYIFGYGGKRLAKDTSVNGSGAQYLSRS